MKILHPIPSVTGALLLSVALAPFVATPRAAAQEVGFASQIADYTAGTSVSATFQNAGAALGKPGGNVGSGTLNPFSPNFAGSELTGIGVGGQLTLGLSNFVTVGAAGTRELGIFGNVGLVNVGSTGQPAAGNPATVFGLRSVLVSVSADGLNFVPLNGGNLITSTLPANFYTNPDTTDVNAPPPGNPTLANFNQPFTGSLSDFNGETYAQTLATLGGSAGGTWLDLSATGLSQVGYVRFNEPTSGGANGGIFYLNGVSLNGALIAAAIVPEPGAWTLLAAGGVLLLLLSRRGRRQLVARPAGIALVAAWGLLAAGGTAQAQMLTFADIRNWTGTGANQAAMVVDWHDGKTPEPLVWGYRWDGMATGLQMIQAVDAADPRFTLFTQTFSFGTAVYGIGYDLNNNGGTFTRGDPALEDGSASDPADHYAEGFGNSRFWGYLNGVGNPYNGGSWMEAQVGAGDRALANGVWDGWSLSTDVQNFSIPDAGFPRAADAVPEPSVLALAALGLAALAWFRRARRAAVPRPA